MTSTGLLSDVVLPAATWYEKDDLSSTDMHPFVHAFTPAIAPPWQARTDYDTFLAIADRFSELAAEHLGTRTDVLPVPLLHDTPDELAQPGDPVERHLDAAAFPLDPRLAALLADLAHRHETQRGEQGRPTGERRLAVEKRQFQLLARLRLHVELRPFVGDAVQRPDASQADRFVGLGEIARRMIEVEIDFDADFGDRRPKRGQARFDRRQIGDGKLLFHFVVHRNHSRRFGGFLTESQHP